MKKTILAALLLSAMLLLTACGQMQQPAEVDAGLPSAEIQPEPATPVSAPATPEKTAPAEPAGPSAEELKAAAHSAEWQQLVDDAVADGWVCGEQWVCKHGGPRYVDTALEKDGETQVLCGLTHAFLSPEEGTMIP